VSTIVKALSVALVCAASLAACGGDSQGASCLAELDLECDPTWPATFDSIYERKLEDSCASSDANCHGRAGNKGGLTLEGPDEAYDALLGIGQDHPRVLPGDPECSILMQRLESTDPTIAMPPGRPLTEGERCAVRQWIANGAERR
jgi:hypothetical protein